MGKYIYLMLTLALCASCQSTSKKSYNIDSVASPKGTEIFQPNWENIAKNYQFPSGLSMLNLAYSFIGEFMLSRPTTANGIHEICIRKDTILINITLKHGGRRISLVTKTSYLYSKPKNSMPKNG